MNTPKWNRIARAFEIIIVLATIAACVYALMLVMGEA